MTWRLEKACAWAVVVGDEGATRVKVHLMADRLERFCIGLCLLDKGLIERLDLVGAKDGNAFRLQRSAKATSIQLGKGKAVMSLSLVELERWVYFTLRAVRDGVAEVDHIDVEAPLNGDASCIVDVVVAFPAAMPPASPDEVWRRLDL